MSILNITLIIVGVITVAGLTWTLVRAWRYRRDNPNEIYWPYSGELNNKEKNVENVKKD